MQETDSQTQFVCLSVCRVPAAALAARRGCSVLLRVQHLAQHNQVELTLIVLYQFATSYDPKEIENEVSGQKKLGHKEPQREMRH